MMFAQLQRLAKKPQVHRRVSVSGRHHSGRCSGYRAGGFVLSGTAAHGEEQTRTGKVNAIQQGIITASTKTRLEELEAQKSDLEVSILQAQLQRPRYTKELVVNWISQFKYGDVNSREYQRRIIDTFVNSIYVFDDRLVFTCNFKGGTQTITLKEIEEAFGSDLVGMSPPLKKARKIVDFPCFLPY